MYVEGRSRNRRPAKELYSYESSSPKRLLGMVTHGYQFPSLWDLDWMNEMLIEEGR